MTVNPSSIRSRSGEEIPLRIYTPPIHSPDLPGLVVFFHGGGWVYGDLDSHDGMCRDLAAGSRNIVVAVDYRLAPEHPFPAGLEGRAGCAGLGIRRGLPPGGGRIEGSGGW